MASISNGRIAWRLRRTAVYDLYRRIKKPRASKVRTLEKRFYGQLVDPNTPGCIIDIGANVGSKTEIFSALASLEFNLPAFRDELEQSIFRLTKIANYRFNAAITEPPEQLALRLFKNAIVDPPQRDGASCLPSKVGSAQVSFKFGQQIRGRRALPAWLNDELKAKVV
jgi:hypothetical protein